MRINISKSKNNEFVYVIKDYYNSKSRTTKIYQKLGTIDSLMKDKNLSRKDVISWAKEYAKQLTLNETIENQDTSISFSSKRLIDIDVQRKFNCGYLFLQDIYYQLKLDKTCRNIKNRHHFQFDINAILSDLIYGRILFPSSKKSTFEQAFSLLEHPRYKRHDVYRALSFLAKESNYIQAELYKNSNFIIKRNTHTLYYDCTNYYFEIEEDDDFRKYGKSKENRPNPIIGMGLMMDGDGVPLAFDLYEGNKNEQVTLKPLEKRIIKDFEVSRFIYCSDAGLASKTNKQFNRLSQRAYIITQSLKKLKKDDREVALTHTGFLELGSISNKRIDLHTIDFSMEENKNRIFYKELPIEKPIEERLIVTYSPKYAIYQEGIRNKQIFRATKRINANGKIKNNRKNPNDPARFIKKITTDKNGVITEDYYTLDTNKIHEESRYDGFYAVTTNLEEEDIKAIIGVIERRWQIEECFRIMKTDFKARPIYLQEREHIEAHFLTCFISLIIYRILASKLDTKYTISETLRTLRDMEVVDTQYNGYIPAYRRTQLTDDLHEVFKFRTDYEITSKKKMRNIIKNTKIK